MGLTNPHDELKLMVVVLKPVVTPIIGNEIKTPSVVVKVNCD